MYKKIKQIATLTAAFIGLSASSVSLTHAGYWVGPNGLTACGAKALQMFKNAEDEGLSAADFKYGVDAAEAALSGRLSPEAADAKINDSMIRYIDQIRNGRFDPKNAAHLVVMRPDVINEKAIISQGMASGSCEWMDNQAPPYEGYRQLKPVLKKYRELARQGNWPKITEKVNIAPGDSHEAIPFIRQQLSTLGYLNYSEGDSYYDETLVVAVKAFQSTHGLLPDGKIGSLTAKELNKTPADRVRQIVITMERWRWLPHNPGSRHIKVNVAGFLLEAVDNGQVALRSRIIVGADYRKTPVFTANMTEVKFNPSWNVPYNLAVKDKLPKIREDPSYLTKNHFVLTRTVNGREQLVSPHSVNWNSVTPGNFNYHLRQTPGHHNALGKIRFTIHSPFDIFLHSTPDQHLFDYPVRTFSSGCIRVQKVAELGEFVLNNKSTWPTSRVEQEMEGSNTKVVPLSHSIPVYIMYNTVFVDENGVAHFMDDVYDQDSKLASYMKRWL